MSSPASGATPDGYTLLRAFLSPHASSRQAGRAKGRGTAGSQLQDRLPSGGTLPGLEARWGETALARMALSSLRSLAQVLFINNPISGLLLLLALLIQSPWMGLFAGLGIVSANLTARAIAADAPAASQGIYGFNGALVGAAIAAFSSIGGADSLVAWMLIVVVGAIVTTLLLHGLGRWLFRVAGLPPLTLPFCLVTWLLLALVA